MQITAETAYDMVSPGPSVRRIRGNRRGKRKRLNPPQDIREGVSNAFHIVKEVNFQTYFFFLIFKEKKECKKKNSLGCW